MLCLLSCHEDSTSIKTHIAQGPDDVSFFQRAYPNASINPQSVIDSRSHFKKISKGSRNKSFDSWTNEGPLNIGGRVTDIARHPENSELFYIGTSVGGVWKTEDGGNSWLPIFDDEISLSIGSIVLAPSNPNVIYVGTGEANASASSAAFSGTGVYKSIDAGLTWENVGLESSQHIARLVVDKEDSDIVYAAATGLLYDKGTNRGLYKTNNGGDTWDQLLFVSDSTACIDVVVNPENPDIIYTAMWERLRFPWIRDYGGQTSAIHRSKDGGITWERLENGLPDNQDSRGRIGLAISTSNPDKLIAVITDGEIRNSFEGVYASKDGGDSWSNINGNIFDEHPSPFSSFGWFFGNVRISPLDEDNIALLGLHSFFSENTGDSWRVNTRNHVDNHCLEYFLEDDNDILVGNDGGLYRSRDGGINFTFISRIPITQFYNIEVDFQNPERLFGGTQDNNTIATFTGNTDDYISLLGGDGFHVNVDPRNSDQIYAEFQWGNLFKSEDGGDNFEEILEGIENERTNWNTPVVLSPINPSILYYGSYKLHQSIEGELWAPISDDLTKGEHPSGSSAFGTITTIAPSFQDLNTIYVGTDDGEVSITRNGGLNWTRINEGIPNRYVTELAVNPSNDAEAIITLSGYRYNDYEPHIMITQDYGSNWTDITGNLPDIPVNDIEYHHTNDNILFVGTDLGVWSSLNKGLDWELFSDGMPVTIVNDLKIHAPTDMLYAGTFGRSIFKANIREELSSNVDITIENLNVYPNPSPSNGAVNIKLPKAIGSSDLEVFSMLGEKIYSNKINSDVVLEDLEVGTFLIRVSNNGHVYQSKVIIQ